MADRIHPGMTEAEVVTVLGRPAGNYAGPGITYIGSGPWPFWTNPEGYEVNGITVKAWISDAGLVGVMFNQDGLVTSRWWGPVGVRELRSPLDCAYRAIRWLFW
jgi:hypothetical protein